jgi:hypothetical protein
MRPMPMGYSRDMSKRASIVAIDLSRRMTALQKSDWLLWVGHGRPVTGDE